MNLLMTGIRWRWRFTNLHRSNVYLIKRGRRTYCRG